MNKRKLFQKFNKSQISKDFQIKEVNIQMQIMTGLMNIMEVALLIKRIFRFEEGVRK